MLPAEKSERWVRRIGYLALILMAIIIIVWLVGFISRVTRMSLEQREAPEEGRAPAAAAGRAA
jgi:hypothetical protein